MENEAMIENEKLEGSETRDIPYIAYESSLMRSDRANKRLWILCVILIILLVGSNAGWLVFESQFEDVTVEQQVDTGNGDALVAGGNIYGSGETNN